MRATVLLAAGLLCSTIAHAGIWGSGNLLPWPDPAAPAQPVEVTQPVLRSATLGVATIVFEKTTLATVRAALGTGEVHHQGDAAGSYYWLCYRLADGSAVGVFANGEMGGPEHAVTDIRIAANPGSEAAQCPLLSKAVFRSDTGLGLGDSEAAFTMRLGPAGGRQGDNATWVFARRSTDDVSEWTTDQWIDVKFQNGRAAAIVFGQETSN